MSAFEYWKFAVKREIRLGREYIKVWEDEATLALCFGYPEPFMHRLLHEASTRGEVQGILDLMAMEYDVEVEWNGNLRIFNI